MTRHGFTLLIGMGICLLMGLHEIPAQIRPRAPWMPSNLDTTLLGNLRGAKLTSAAQLDSLRARHGIHTILNLAKDALPKRGDNEIQWTAERGMRYVSVYLGSSPPTAEKYRMIQELVKGGGVYIHCAHGADRTGAVIARLRQDLQGWSSAHAYTEARKYGFKPWLTELKRWMGIRE